MTLLILSIMICNPDNTCHPTGEKVRIGPYTTVSCSEGPNKKVSLIALKEVREVFYAKGTCNQIFNGSK